MRVTTIVGVFFILVPNLGLSRNDLLVAVWLEEITDTVSKESRGVLDMKNNSQVEQRARLLTQWKYSGTAMMLPVQQTSRVFMWQYKWYFAILGVYRFESYWEHSLIPGLGYKSKRLNIELRREMMRLMGDDGQCFQKGGPSILSSPPSVIVLKEPPF